MFSKEFLLNGLKISSVNQSFSTNFPLRSLIGLTYIGFAIREICNPFNKPGGHDKYLK